MIIFNLSWILLKGIRMLDGKATDTIEGSSLSYRADYIDIYSCCWGPKDDGTRFGKPGYLAGKALQIGAERVIIQFCAIFLTFDWDKLHSV